MPKFRKKPVEVEAVKYAGNGNLDPRGAVPDWMWKAYEDGTMRSTGGLDPLIIKTLEGEMVVSPGDWIIRGTEGEIYPCKPKPFETTFEPKATALALAIREPFAKDRDHLTESGTFQSDKFPWCSAGFVPLKITDPAARDLLAEYARRRAPIDAEFPRDLLEALANVPEEENAGYGPFEKIVEKPPAGDWPIW